MVQHDLPTVSNLWQARVNINQGFFQDFPRGGGGQISILEIIGVTIFFSLYVQVSLNFLFSMHITTATRISAYIGLGHFRLNSLNVQ